METLKHESLYSMHIKHHNGWTEAEDKMLFDSVKSARENKRPLKSVFDNIAKLTGRKSNSVRNYYYSRIRDEDISKAYEPYVIQASSFVPFEPSEVKEMLRKLLADQAKGMSVRSITMQMGGGNTTQMLRYQNKYRSVIKNEPNTVNEVLHELESEGIPAFNPYAPQSSKKRAGRPRKSDTDNEQLIDVMAQTVSELENVEGLNVAALFESLGALAVSAGKGAAAIRRLEAIESSELCDAALLRDEISELREKLHSQDSELAHERVKLLSAVSSFRKLVKVNTDFLELSGVAKVSSLGTYIKDLTRAVSACSVDL